MQSTSNRAASLSTPQDTHARRRGEPSLEAEKIREYDVPMNTPEDPSSLSQPPFPHPISSLSYPHIVGGTFPLDFRWRGGRARAHLRAGSVFQHPPFIRANMLHWIRPAHEYTMLCAKSSCSYGRRWRPQNQGHCIPHCIPTPPMLPLARSTAAPLSSHAGGGVANSPVLCCAAARAPRFHPQPQQQQQLHQQQQPQPQPQLAVPAGSRRWGTHAAAWKEALGAHTRSISTQQAACMLACAHVCARQCRGSRTLAFSCASSHGCVQPRVCKRAYTGCMSEG